MRVIPIIINYQVMTTTYSNFRPSDLLQHEKTDYIIKNNVGLETKYMMMRELKKVTNNLNQKLFHNYNQFLKSMI